MIDRLDNNSKQYLLSLPLVAGIGHGLKETGGIQTNNEAIIVLVKKKIPPDRLAKHQLVPASICGMLTDVIEVGELVAHARGMSDAPDGVLEPGDHGQPETGQPENAAVDTLEIMQSRTARVRPAPPGVSIGHYRVTAGTFGAVVYDNSTGIPIILSNNHVLANATNGRDLRARLNDPVLQPGSIDGGRQNRNIIARLARFIPLAESPGLNLVDCAAAQPLQNELVVPEILGIGKVQGVTAPSLGMNVKKSGRTTGLTYGQVRAVNVIANVSYGRNRVLRFEKQILTTRISSPGDSGSLVLDEQNRAVGLLFAGSDTSTILNPIQTVLDLLKARF